MTVDPFFKSQAHRERFFTAILGMDKVDDSKLDPEYAAALYVLTATVATWERARNYVSGSGIRFEDLLADEHFSEGYAVLIKWAANLFNGNLHIDPVELMRLDEDNFLLATDALQIRRYSLNIVKED